MMRRWRRHVPVLVPLLVLVAILAWRSGDPGSVLQDLRNQVFDYFQRFSPRPYEQMPVRIVDLDDETLERYGQWPWPRTLVARLIADLANAGAAVITMDIVFAEPDQTSPRNIAKVWGQLGDISRIERGLTALPDHDDVLKSIVAQAPVVTGFVGVAERTVKMPVQKGNFAIAGDDPAAFIPGFAGAVTNVEGLAAAASGNGSFNLIPERDGIIRRVPLIVRVGDRRYGTLTTEALRVAQGASTSIVKASGANRQENFGVNTGITAIRIGALEVPTDSRGRLWVHFTRSTEERFLPAWRILDGDFDPALVEGNIVLVGTSAEGLKDLRTSPVNRVLPGVEVHAMAIEQILLQHFLERADWFDGLEYVYVIVLSLVLIFLMRRLGAVWCALIGVAGIGVAVGIAVWGYEVQRVLLDPVTPSLAVLLVYLSSSLLNYLQNEAEKSRVRNAFRQYLSPALVEQLAEDPTRLRLGGEMRNMTFLFCDIRGFTTISEQFKSNPQALTRLINRFLTPMTDLILETGGTIDKYMGDCIMAFWNAPLDVPDHPAKACSAALSMFARLDELNAVLKQEAEAAGRPHLPLRIGIGLNSGEVVVGNMGSEQRFDYSVLGDAVNLASRLEGQSKTYGVNIVIGDNTAAGADGFALLEIDLIAVKGKTEAARIFALLGDNRLAGSASFRSLAESHAQMLHAYREQDWDKAAQIAANCQALEPGLTALYDLYLERIREYRQTPPGPDWDGVYYATSK
ncbi:MAG: adenylate/guanylate cyclase domain-containing protein [Sneathiellaceae bacterium]